MQAMGQLFRSPPLPVVAPAKKKPTAPKAKAVGKPWAKAATAAPKARAKRSKKRPNAVTKASAAKAKPAAARVAKAAGKRATATQGSAVEARPLPGPKAESSSTSGWVLMRYSTKGVVAVRERGGRQLFQVGSSKLLPMAEHERIAAAALKMLEKGTALQAVKEFVTAAKEQAIAAAARPAGATRKRKAQQTR